MPQPVVSKKKAAIISNGIFLICVGIMIFTNTWWPGIILAVAVTITSRQYLSGRYYHAIISAVIFTALFILAIARFNFDVLAPVLFILAGIFLIVREYFFTYDTNGEEKSEEIKDDVDLDAR
jgi:predicted membrane protein